MRTNASDSLELGWEQVSGPTFESAVRAVFMSRNQRDLAGERELVATVYQSCRLSIDLTANLRQVERKLRLLALWSAIGNLANISRA